MNKQLALKKIMAICARRETCTADAVKILNVLMEDKHLPAQVVQREIQEIITTLKKEGFIDDERFAKSYVRDSYNLRGWGEHKISRKLKAKCISQETIREALASEGELADKALRRVVLQKRAQEGRKGDKEMEKLQKKYDKICLAGGDSEGIKKERRREAELYKLKVKISAISKKEREKVLAFAVRRGFDTQSVVRILDETYGSGEQG